MFSFGILAFIFGVGAISMFDGGGDDGVTAEPDPDTPPNPIEPAPGPELDPTPPPEPDSVDGLLVTPSDNGDVVLSLTDDFTGGGNYGGGDQFSTLDLSALTADMQITVSDSGVISVSPADASWPAVTFEEIDRVILGNGADFYDGSAGPGRVEVVAGNGSDTVFGSSNADVLTGAGFAAGDSPEVWDGVGPSILFGKGGDDTLLGGLGDTLLGGLGEDLFQVWGHGGPNAGPAIIVDFNPVEDALEYSWVTPLDVETFPEVAIEDSSDGLLILENGQVMAVLPGVTLADNPSIMAGDRSVGLPI